MVIRTFFAIQRQSNSMARGDKTWESTPSLLSRNNQVRWHVETNMVIHTIFAIQRQSSPMARGDKHGHPYHFCYLETIKSDGTQRQTW